MTKNQNAKMVRIAQVAGSIALVAVSAALFLVNAWMFVSPEKVDHNPAAGLSFLIAMVFSVYFLNKSVQVTADAIQGR